MDTEQFKFNDKPVNHKFSFSDLHEECEKDGCHHDGEKEFSRSGVINVNHATQTEAHGTTQPAIRNHGLVS